MSHIASALKTEGYEVRMADNLFESDRLEEIVSETGPDFIGISLRNIDDHRIDETIFFVPQLFEAVTRIRRITDKPLIIGGSAYSLFPEILLEKSGADYGLIGEGDDTMPRLVRLLHGTVAMPPAEKDLADIGGLVYRRKGTIVRNDVRPVDGARITLPYRQPDMFDYYQTNGGIVNIQTQRGCPYSCCYCTYPVIEGRKVRFRDPEAIVDEIAQVVSRGGRYLFFVDSVFNIDDRHVAAVCETILSRGIVVSWGCFLRPKGITRELMELMARSGLRHVEFGTDSLCDEVLAAYGKSFTVDDIVCADELANEAQVRHAHFLISGGPGETSETLKVSYNNSLRLKKTAIFPFIGMRLYPGTPLYDRALAEGIITARTNLLTPFFYITPDISKEEIRSALEVCHKQSPRWIIDDPTPEQQRVILALRTKSIPGPLWEFLAQ